MNKYGLIFSSALLIAALMMHGQEAAPPSVDLFPEQEEEEGSPTPPPNGPELPGLKELDDSLGPSHWAKTPIRCRCMRCGGNGRIALVNDPDVRSAKKYAQAAGQIGKAKTAPQLLRRYSQRMSALATTPELKLALQALKDVHQNMLNQPRVRPTPTPVFSGTPSPTPTSTPFKKKGKEKHKKKKVHR